MRKNAIRWAKAQYLIDLVKRWVVRTDARTFDHKIIEDGVTSGDEVQAERPQSEKYSFAPDFDERSKFGRTVHRGGQTDPNLTGGLPFEAEMSAEDHFVAHRGKEARGNFQEVGSVKWSHDESDWSIEDFNFEFAPRSADASAAQFLTESIPQQGMAGSLQREPQLKGSLARLQKFALQRRWLASGAAIEKLSRNSALLSDREWAAIEHVLNKAHAASTHQTDAEIVRSVLAKGQLGASTEKIDAPRVHARRDTDVETDPDDKRSDRKTNRFLKDDFLSSIKRIGAAAAAQNWLSPKSLSALGKLKNGNSVLTRHEVNALNYLLDRCKLVPTLEADTEMVRKKVTD